VCVCSSGRESKACREKISRLTLFVIQSAPAVVVAAPFCVYPLIVFLSIKNKTTTKNNVENNRPVSPQKCFGKPNPRKKRKKKLLTNLNAHFFNIYFNLLFCSNKFWNFHLLKKHTQKWIQFFVVEGRRNNFLGYK
jgi:hypothetical protein